MAQGHGLHIFPCLLREATFADAPLGLQYMLATINAIPFPDSHSDEKNCLKMLQAMRGRFSDATPTPTGVNRHNIQPELARPEDETMAEVPVAVPRLPGVISERPSVISSLRSNLLGFINSIFDVIVDTSLNIISNFCGKVFLALGVCPEDVWVKNEVATLICSADPDVKAQGKVTMVTIRRALKVVLDRNLLQGSMQSGAKPHDMVRELVRDRIDVQRKQRLVGDAFVAAYPDGGWANNSSLQQYCEQALQLHMTEALDDHPLDDLECQRWLDGNPIDNFVVRCASLAFGHSNLMQLGARLEARGLSLSASQRYCSASMADDMAHSSSSNSIGRRQELQLRAADLLQQSEQTQEGQALELAARGSCVYGFDWNSSTFESNVQRIDELVDAGVEITSVNMCLVMGTVCTGKAVSVMGLLKANEYNFTDRSKQAEGIELFFNKYYKQALDKVSIKDPYWMVCALCAAQGGAGPTFREHERARELQKEWIPHATLERIIQEYDHDVHFPLFASSPVGYDLFPRCDLACYVLSYYGDIPLARMFLKKLIDACARGTSDVVAMMACSNISSSVWREAGLSELALDLFRVVGFTMPGLDATARKIHAELMTPYGFDGQENRFYGVEFYIAQFKRRLWLLAPHKELSQSDMEEWLATHPAHYGSAAQDDKIDTTPNGFGCNMGAGCAEVFESLDRFEEAIIAAQTDVRNYPTNAFMLVVSHTAIGRSQAKLGRIQEATASFKTAIKQAHRCELPFDEMIAHRDYIVHVLDAQGKRESQMVDLGYAINQLVRPPNEYAAVLGHGIDPDRAVAAFKSQHRQ